MAVVLLVGSVVTGAYLQQAAREAGPGQGMSAGASPEAVVPFIRSGLEETAVRCIDGAVELQTAPDVDEGGQGLWRVDQSFRSLFAAAVGKEWGSRRFERYCLTAEAGEATVALSTLPMGIRAINRLGMAVNMTAPAGFRISGAVNFTFTPGDGRKLERKVDFGVERASWYPLALFQADRLRRDCVNEGLLELLFRETFGGFLDADLAVVLEARNRTRRADPGSTATVGDWWKDRPFGESGLNAVNLSMSVMEQALFGAGREPRLSGLIGENPGRPLDLSAALDHPGGQFTGPAAFGQGADGGLELAMAPFCNGVVALPLDGSAAGVERFRFEVGSEWLGTPQPQFRNVAFAGEEVEVDVYMLEVSVTGVYRLRAGPDANHTLRLDIPVHLGFTIDQSIHEENRAWAEEGRRHCEVEDPKLFESEYAGLYCRPVQVFLDISNSSDVVGRAMAGTASVDVYVDGDYLGTFRRGDFGQMGLLLERVPSGPHEFSVIWNDRTRGTLEAASAGVAVGGRVERFALTTQPRSDNSAFWTCALYLMKDAPARERMTVLVRFVSLLTGCPEPAGIGSAPPGSPEYAQHMMAWLDDIEESSGLDGGTQMQVDPGRMRMLQGAACVVKVLRETTRIMEQALKSVKDMQERQAGLQGSTAEMAYANEGGAETISLKASGAADGGGLVMSRPAGEARWRLTGSGSNDGARAPAFSAGELRVMGAALDIGTTVLVVLSAYLKYVKYSATDGTISESGKLDLHGETVKVVAQCAKLFVNYAVKPLVKGIAKGARVCDSIGAGLGVVIGIVTVLQLSYGENVKFRGDNEFWAALFTGFDAETAGLYLAIASIAVGVLNILVFLGMATAAQPYLAPVTAALALATIVVFMFMDWKGFTTVVSGTLADEDRDKMARTIQDTLRDTAGTVARLNAYPADEEMLAARQSRGLAALMSAVASFVPDMRLAFETRNLSRYQYDTAWAKEHQARAARGLRFFMIAMWKQVDEFGGAGWTALHPLQDQKWSSRITVTWPDGQKGSIELDYIQRFLLGLNASGLAGTRIDFEITGRVVADRLGLWMDPMSRIGDQVRLWGRRLSASQEMKTYLYGLDGARYRNDWGFLRVRLSPSYSTCNLAILGAGPFELQDGRTAATATRYQMRLEGREEPYRLYLEPGTYTLEFSGQLPEQGLNLKGGKATVALGDLYSPLFGQDPVNVMPEPDCIYFQIFNGFNGSVRVGARIVDENGEVLDGLGTTFAFDNTTRQGGKVYINSGWVPGFCFDGTQWGLSEEQQRSLTCSIRFTVELDRESDGFCEGIYSREVSLRDIREDQKARMREDNGKFTDQLGYRLSVLDQPFQVRSGADADGNVILRDQYIEWGKIG